MFQSAQREASDTIEPDPAIGEKQVALSYDRL